MYICGFKKYRFEIFKSFVANTLMLMLDLLAFERALKMKMTTGDKLYKNGLQYQECHV